MSFTKKHQEIETNEKDKDTGIMGYFADMLLPALPKMLEKATGQKITSNSEILLMLIKMNNKLEDFMRDCSEQFIQQSQQLTSLQKISKLVSSKETKAIHFTEED